MLDLWWTKHHWGMFSLSTLASSATYSINWTTLIIIHHHPGLVK
jgi:hypothetical protein